MGGEVPHVASTKTLDLKGNEESKTELLLLFFSETSSGN